VHIVTTKALAAVRREGLLSPGDVVLAALSGGADSVTLLYVLLKLKDELGLREVAAAHLNHLLRGAEADRDEAFVRELCEKWGIRLFVKQVDVAALSRETGTGLEEAGRQARYAFFETVPDIDQIATGHTLSDNLETVLFRMTRGTGLKGLGGIPYRRGNIVRPLLDCSREEIEDYCRVNGLPYVTDSTNLDPAFSRNRIRQTVLPALRELNPEIGAAVSRMIRLLREDEDCLEQQAAEALQAALIPQPEPEDYLDKLKLPDYPLYNTEKWVDLPPAVLGRVLALAAAEAGCPAEERHIRALAELLRAGAGKINLPGDRTAVLKNQIFTFQNNFRSAAISYHYEAVPGECYDFGAVKVRFDVVPVEKLDENQKIHNFPFKNVCSYDIIRKPVVLRSRLPGDSFHPHKDRPGQTVGNFLNANGIPVHRRNSVPILCDADGVLLVPGLGADERAWIRDGTEKAAVLTCF